MVVKKKKRDVSFSDLRARLEEYAGMKDRQEGWYETGEMEEKRNLFAYYPFSALWQMHRFLFIKTALIILVIILVFSLTFINIPFTAAILQNIKHLTTWETDFATLGREALPAVQRLWTGSVEDGLESPVIAPPPANSLEKLEVESLQLSLPLEGELVQSFGLFENAVGDEQMSYGLLLAVPAAKPVHAAAPGFVKEVRKVHDRGFGLVLEHGGGMETYYNFLQEVAVDEQVRVEQGEVIGYSGIEAWEGGVAVYFEVRRNGRPVDPLPMVEKEVR